MKKRSYTESVLSDGYSIGCIYRCVLLLLMGMMLPASCVHNHSEIEPLVFVPENKTINLSVAVPYAVPNASQSRAIGAEQENTIKSVFVLAFKVTRDGNNNIESETYDYFSTGDRSPNNNEGHSTQDFIVSVRIEDYEQRFVVIANADNEVLTVADDSQWIGIDKETMLSQLKVSLAGGQDRWQAIDNNTYTAFPMWGESSVEVIRGTTVSLSMPVPMMRMIARIDVVIDEDAEARPADKFKMSKVYLYNTNTSGHIVPASFQEEEGNGHSYLSVVAPTIPDGATISRGPIEYTDFELPGKQYIAMKGVIYTFETKAPADGDMLKATCLVIGGYYDNDDYETFYRVDFFESDGATLRDILRNHQYVVRIISVSGRGHETEEIAFKSKSVNMIAEILSWNEAGMNNVAFDGQSFLSVNNDRFVFYRDAKTGVHSDNVLYVLTDYFVRDNPEQSGWYIDRITDAADSSQDVTWVRPSINRGEANEKATVVLEVDENPNEQEREAIIWIAAGRLRFQVKVVQLATSPVCIEVVDKNGMAISKLVFTSVAGIPEYSSESFTVNWKPKNADLIVTNTGVSTYSFPAESGAPQNGIIRDANGTKTFVITPPNFTDAELLDNPFMEKVSKIGFVTTDGNSYETGRIFLQQKNINLLTDVKADYILNGQTEKIKVWANFGWAIKSITDNHDILANKNNLISKTGGNNIVTGDELALVMASDIANPSRAGQKATIYIRNLADNREWPIDITVADVLYAGNFGGKLMSNESGVWQYEFPLYINGRDEIQGPEAGEWYGGPDSVSGQTSDVEGKNNTYLLSIMAPDDVNAINACFKKNMNYRSITGISDTNYDWFLPSIKQLMAMWAINSVIPEVYEIHVTSYWSSSDLGNGTSHSIHFLDGHWTWESKLGKKNRVRCVRELK